MAENEDLTPTQPTVVSQEGALVGDENLPDPREPGVSVVKEDADAQVAPEREAPADTVPVHEVVVTVDEVITDPSAPEAVQIPDAGRGSLDLPIHALANGTPEQQLSEAPKDDGRGDVE